MLKRMTFIAAKIESSYGVDASCAGVDMFLAYNVSFKPEVDALTRDPMSGSFGELEPQKGARRSQVTFSVDIYGSGTAGTAPPGLDPLLRACGMVGTTEAGVQVMYEPYDASSANPFESCTIELWQDGLQHILTGCRGKFSINMEMGQRGRFDFTMDAAEFTDTDAQAPQGIYSTVTPPTCLNQAFSLEGYSAIIPALRIDVNNAIARAPSVSASSGYARVDIAGRKVEGTISPEAVTNATFPFYTKWSTGVKSALSITLGSASGNKIIVSAPRVHYTGMSFSDRSGILAMDMPFQASEMVANVSGTCTAGTTASLIKNTSIFTADNLYDGGRITMVLSGALQNKTRQISTTSATNGATLQSAFGSTPSTGQSFAISYKEIQLLFL